MRDPDGNKLSIHRRWRSPSSPRLWRTRQFRYRGLAFCSVVAQFWCVRRKMNVTGQAIILRIIAIAFYLAAYLAVARMPPLAIVLAGIGLLFSVLGWRRSRQSQLRLTEQQKKKVFVIIASATAVGCIGSPLIIGWPDPRTHLWMLVLMIAGPAIVLIGFSYWRIFKRGV